MPDWMYDWEVSVLDWWHVHPVTFWTVAVASVTVYVVATVMKARR